VVRRSAVRARHATGLVEVMKRISVAHLWMNRPWLFAAETLQHFHGLFTLQGLIDRMRKLHPYLVELEDEAKKQGTQIHDVFQGTQIGKWTVLAPSRDRYIRLIPDLDKTPDRKEAADTLSGFLAEALRKARDKLYESWDIETLSNNPDPTSASNETSVVQFAELDGKRLLLTADVGPEGLQEAANYAASIGRLQRPHMIQIPHHGSRRNVTPYILNQWLGGKVNRGTSVGSAIASIGDNKDEYPRGQVTNAFLRPIPSTSRVASRSCTTPAAREAGAMRNRCPSSIRSRIKPRELAKGYWRRNCAILRRLQLAGAPVAGDSRSCAGSGCGLTADIVEDL
jgi:hypothetical protein